jgi:hypothetical protein
LSASDDGVRIACGDGVLCVTQLQRAGGKRLAAADFLRGFALGAGRHLRRAAGGGLSPVKPSPDSSPLQRLRRLAAHPEFRAGAREISGVAPGLAAWGLMTGVAMVQSGMSTVEAVAMTLLVFAGSSQLAAIPLIAASAPVWVILATSFCVNLRFVVFSAHLRAYVMYLPRWARLLGRLRDGRHDLRAVRSALRAPGHRTGRARGTDWPTWPAAAR